MINLDYKGKEIFVGIDVHLKSWDIQVMTQNVVHKQVHKAKPNPCDLAKFLKTYYPNATYKCVYEAGFCGFWIQEELNRLGIDTIVAHAADIPTTDKEKRFKDDKIDSKKLARALRSGELKGIFIPPKQQQKDRSIVRQRYSYASKERSIKNRILSHLYFYGIRNAELDELKYWSNNRIIALESYAEINGDDFLILELKRLRMERSFVLEGQRNIRRLSKTERYKEDFEILRSLPGVGLLTAMVFLTEIGNVARFINEDKLISYIGFTPSCRISGNKEYIGGISKRGNTKVMTALVLAAWMAIRTPNKLSVYYEHCRVDLNKNSNKAIILVAKKMVKYIYVMLRNKTKYKH